jgi:hypothetical protein
VVFDGYHRWFAHRSLNLPEIGAEVRRGTREDALRLSLAANATHGKQRTKGDYTRGYDIAVRNALVEPDAWTRRPRGSARSPNSTLPSAMPINPRPVTCRL